MSECTCQKSALNDSDNPTTPEVLPSRNLRARLSPLDGMNPLIETEK
jgi:hypothetical protein